MRMPIDSADAGCLDPTTAMCSKRTLSKAGADLSAFQSLMDGWNKEHGRPAAEIRHQVAAGSINDPADLLSVRRWSQPADVRLVQMISADTRRISKEIAATRGRLAALEAELDRAAADERASAVDLLRELCRRYDLRMQDITDPIEYLPPAPAQTSAGEMSLPSCDAKRRAVQFRGPAGELWLGRGRRPSWLRQLLRDGRQLSEFASPPDVFEPAL